MQRLQGLRRRTDGKATRHGRVPAGRFDAGGGWRLVRPFAGGAVRASHPDRARCPQGSGDHVRSAGCPGRGRVAHHARMAGDGRRPGDRSQGTSSACICDTHGRRGRKGRSSCGGGAGRERLHKDARKHRERDGPAAGGRLSPGRIRSGLHARGRRRAGTAHTLAFGIGIVGNDRRNRGRRGRHECRADRADRRPEGLWQTAGVVRRRILGTCGKARQDRLGRGRGRIPAAQDRRFRRMADARRHSEVDRLRRRTWRGIAVVPWLRAQERRAFRNRRT